MSLANAVAWAAIVACIVSVIAVVFDRRDRRQAREKERAAEIQAAYDRGRASLADQLEQARKDRDYWRDFVVRRAERPKE